MARITWGGGQLIKIDNIIFAIKDEEISNADLKDYKFFCFNGKPQFIQVDLNRFTNHTRNIYDVNWNLLDLAIQYPQNESEIVEMPNNLKKMLSIVSVLSQKCSFLRVDLYNISGKIYFGEMTFYPEGGFCIFDNKESEEKWGKLINIDINKKE